MSYNHRFGHVEAAKLVIAAGAIVNSTGMHNNVGYYPPLWVCWSCLITTLQVLLDAGADPTWHARRGVSVARGVRGGAVDTPELQRKIELLVRYGAIDAGTSWLTVRSGVEGGENCRRGSIADGCPVAVRRRLSGHRSGGLWRVRRGVGAIGLSSRLGGQVSDRCSTARSRKRLRGRNLIGS